MCRRRDRENYVIEPACPDTKSDPLRTRTLLTKVSGIRDILPELLVDGVRFPPVDP